MQSSSQAIRKANESQFVILEKHLPVSKIDFVGLLIAVLIISMWGANLAYLLTVNIKAIPFWLLPLGILAQTFLYTGLFITAHDAMHGSLYFKNPKINNFLGSAAMMAYAFLSYKPLLQKHWLHHHFPASDRDPDFHNGTHENPFAWFVHFMKGYFGWQQFNGFTIAYLIARWVCHIPHANLFFFWILPLILSSVQLFYFGTYLTHRQPDAGYSNSHRAETTNLSPFWSFMTCYHFGYHREHHEYPHLPWWRLPQAHQGQLSHRAQ